MKVAKMVAMMVAMKLVAGGEAGLLVFWGLSGISGLSGLPYCLQYCFRKKSQQVRRAHVEGLLFDLLQYCTVLYCA
jgi:hypothetical protein